LIYKQAACGYVGQAEAGQETLTPEEFSSRAKYGWKNDPDQVRLVPEKLEPTGSTEKRE
jgi:hypothetical protein